MSAQCVSLCKAWWCGGRGRVLACARWWRGCERASVDFDFVRGRQWVPDCCCLGTDVTASRRRCPVASPARASTAPTRHVIRGTSGGIFAGTRQLWRRVTSSRWPRQRRRCVANHKLRQARGVHLRRGPLWMPVASRQPPQRQPRSRAHRTTAKTVAATRTAVSEPHSVADSRDPEAVAIQNNCLTAFRVCHRRRAL